MEPYYKAFNELNQLLEESKITIEYGSYIAEEDPTDSVSINYIADVYASGAIPTTSRYGVKVNGSYLTYHNEVLKEAFEAFEAEIQKNRDNRLMQQNTLSDYLIKLKERLVVWNERIIETEVVIENKSHWIYFDSEINKDFLSSEGVSAILLQRISKIFQIQQSRIINLLLNSLADVKLDDLTNGVVDEEDGPEKIGALDIYQTALLFHYLKKYEAIKRLSNENLAELLHPLTGHSKQNLRTDKGFGVIAHIISDKVKNKNFNDCKSHNLTAVMDLLNRILEEIRLEIEKNKL